MRLLMTTDTVGGVWNFTITLTRNLLDRGHAVHLVSFGRTPSPEQQRTQQDLQQAHPGTFACSNSEISLEWMQNNATAHADGAAYLDRLLHTAELAKTPDLILSNQFCFGRLPTSIPRIVIAHSDVLSWARACNPAALEPTPWPSRYTTMAQAGLLEATAVVAPTAWMSDALRSGFFVSRDIAVIPNAATVAPGDDPPPPRKLQAITAGRLWDAGKGLEILLDLQTPIPIQVAGENAFEDDSARTQWPAHLHDLGPLPQADLHAQFRSSALYLCTSLYEPFGLAPLEAALCGCALVARDLPSLHEVWGDSALYFHDEPSLRRLLRSLAASPDRLQQAQSRALSRAEAFTTERMTGAYLQLFQAVLTRQQGATPYAA